MEIPTTVTSIDWYEFERYKQILEELTIPTTVKTIPKYCINNCKRLTNITLPLNESQIICGNKIFNTPRLQQAIYLPDSIEVINGKEVDGSTFIIPSTVTSMNCDDFDNYKNNLRFIQWKCDVC